MSEHGKVFFFLGSDYFEKFLEYVPKSRVISYVLSVIYGTYLCVIIYFFVLV